MVGPKKLNRAQRCWARVSFEASETKLDPEMASIIIITSISYKAAGSDGIQPLVLKLVFPFLSAGMLALFNACLTLGYHPKL